MGGVHCALFSYILKTIVPWLCLVQLWLIAASFGSQGG